MKVKLNRLFLLLSLLTVIIFFGLRLFYLNTLPVFVDEAIYVRWSQVMKNEPSLRFLPQSDGKQPLFMWSVMPALKFIADPLVAGRLISVLSGLFTLIGVGVFAYLLSNSLLTGIAGSLVYSLVPFTVFFDRMALVDSMLAMFGVWSLVTGFLFIRTRRADLAMILGFVLGGGLLTKSPAIFFYAWQMILALFFYFPLLKKKTGDHAKLIGGWLLAFIISQAMYAILKLGPSSHLIGSRNLDYVYSFKEVLTHPLVPLIANLQTSIDWYLALLTLPVLFLAVFGLFTKLRFPFFALLCLSLLPLLAQGAIAKVYTSRYILFTTLPVITAAGLGLGVMLSERKLRIFGLLLLIVPLFCSFLYAYYPEKANMPYDMHTGYLEEWTAGTGQREVAAYLIDEAQKGHKIVVGTDGYFGTLPDGLQIYTQNYPGITVIGTGVMFDKVPLPLANSSPDNQIFLLLNRSRNLLPESELAKLTLIKSYDKSPRSDGTHETLQFYRLNK